MQKVRQIYRKTDKRGGRKGKKKKKNRNLFLRLRDKMRVIER